jgi:hypothetical protein
MMKKELWKLRIIFLTNVDDVPVSSSSSSVGFNEPS